MNSPTDIQGVTLARRKKGRPAVKGRFVGLRAVAGTWSQDRDARRDCGALFANVGGCEKARGLRGRG
jgi:hypothetical protein